MIHAYPAWYRKRLTRAAIATAAGLTAAAYNRGKTKKAEACTPRIGSFVRVDGTPLHYVRAGSGPRVLLLHGNGVMLQDWLASGVFDELSKTNEVIAIDRPGFGYSGRPRSVIWTPQAQATAIAKALRQLRFTGATVVGHSLGGLVALALGLDHPEVVSRLVLVSGYYFPTPRADLVLNSLPAIPVVGDILRHTISPITTRAMMPHVEKMMFAPQAVSERWKDNFPSDMIARPSQVRALAADSALAIPATICLSKRYASLRIPTTIVSGDRDKIVRYEGQAQRLHATIPGSEFVLLKGFGHMVHYTAREAILDAIAPQFTFGRGAATVRAS